MQYLRALRRQLQHFVIVDFIMLDSAFDDARIGGINAVDVGINTADIRPEGGGQRHCRGVRPAAADGRDVARRADSLKACDNDDSPRLQLGANAHRIDAFNARLAVRRIGMYSRLPPAQRNGRHPHARQHHSHQGHGYLLAGRKQNVHFTLAGAAADFPSLLNEMIGCIPLCRYDDDHLVFFFMIRCNNAGGIAQLFRIGKGRTPEFFQSMPCSTLHLLLAFHIPVYAAMCGSALMR